MDLQLHVVGKCTCQGLCKSPSRWQRCSPHWVLRIIDVLWLAPGALPYMYPSFLPRELCYQNDALWVSASPSCVPSPVQLSLCTLLIATHLPGIVPRSDSTPWRLSHSLDNQILLGGCGCESLILPTRL